MSNSILFYLAFTSLVLCPLYAQSGSSNSGYSGTSMYEETYEQPYEKPPVEHYEQPSTGYGGTPSYEEHYEQSYEKPHEQSYGGGGVYGGGTGYGTTPIYEEYYPENEEEETETYGYGYGYGSEESTGIVYGEAPTEYAHTETGSAQPVFPPQFKTGYVVDMHFLAGDPNFQYIAYHFCQELYPGFSQCDIYNGTDEHSKFMAVEFVVTAEIFATLPMEERKYWHSHAFPVKAGILVLPDAPPDQDVQLMAGVINTYGKVTDFWHSYQSFPLGGAKIAYGLGAESQIIPSLADEMDKALGLKTTWRERAIARKGLKAEPLIPGANAYLTTGFYPQYVTEMFKVRTIGVTHPSATPSGAGLSEESGESTES